MPPTKPPTLRQQRLGSELRKLRERAGLTTIQAAALLGVNQSRISNIEAGRYAVGPDRVHAIARNYSCADTALIGALVDMTGGRTRGWWEEYREQLPTGMLDLAELEHHATAIRVAQALHIPGLLQTSRHARALFGDAVPPRLPHEIEHLLSYRIKRQSVLHRHAPLPYTALIHEAALHMRVGGPAVAAEQLNHLVEMSEHDNVTILVIPFGKGAFPGSGQGIDYAHGRVVQLDAVQLDTEHGSEFIDAAAQLERYATVLDRLERLALTATESRDLIRRTAAAQT
ncbi:helix-turn-helix domain-containing protein [Streptomyces sp. NPDC058067]|uniref:helix-turn-helix domain-containing protein n=1 Tax=Streptomyces sp. NPDC058067 TaxID=3346324 RepID=UPI0036E025FB